MRLSKRGCESRECLFSEIRHCLFRSLFRPCHASPSPTHSTAHRVRHLTLSPLVPHTQRRLLPSFLPSFSLFLSLFLGYARTHKRLYIRALALSLSLPFSFFHSHSRCVEKRSMRTPWYYVMPADRGSDILCMLMPHNVGFVPLFSVYLLDSSPSPIAFVANGVCVPRAAFPLPSSRAERRDSFQRNYIFRNRNHRERKLLLGRKTVFIFCLLNVGLY